MGCPTRHQRRNRAAAQQLKTEKSEVARARRSSRSAHPGDDVSDYLSETKLKKDAEAGLAKTSLTDLDWFPFAAVPNLTFKSGKAVHPDIVRCGSRAPTN